MQLIPTSDWENNNIRLFVLTEDHVGPDYVGWLEDPEINRYLESRFVAHDLSSTRAFVSQMLEDPKSLFLGIRSKKLGRHVGNIKLSPIDLHHGLGEIGIMIGDRNAWGMGIGADAISLICSIAKKQLRLRKLTAGCYASNQGSSRAFEKAGFAIEGRRPDHFMVDGESEDLVLMARFI